VSHEDATMTERPGSRPSLPGKLGAWLKRRRLGVAAGIVALAYLFILTFPGTLFAHRMTRGNFRVASDVPIDPALAAVLDRAAVGLRSSAIDDPAMVHRVYLCRSAWRRALLAPTGLKAFGSTPMPFGYTVILGRPDVPADRIARGGPRPSSRALSGVIAHERAHALINARFGPLAGLSLPSWKKEGYCDYVAGETSFPIAEAKRLIRDGRDAPEPSFRYARAYLIVKYLIEVEGLSVEGLMALRVDERAMLAKVRANLDRL
jgi:hypothetical protein